MSVEPDFEQILSPRVLLVDFGQWLRQEVARWYQSADAFFAPAYRRIGFPAATSPEEVHLILERLGAPGGPHLLAWLGEEEKAAAARALAWSSKFAPYDTAWANVPQAAQRFLLAICGIEADTETGRIPEFMKALRDRLGPRLDGGPLSCMSALALQGDPPLECLSWPVSEARAPTGMINLYTALRTRRYQQMGDRFPRKCQKAGILIPVLPEFQRLFVHRAVPPGGPDVSDFPPPARLCVAAMVAWALRRAFDKHEWLELFPDERDLLVMCGGVSLLASQPATFAQLESLRLQIIVTDMRLARRPDPREAAEESFVTPLLRSPVSFHGGLRGSLHPILQYSGDLRDPLPVDTQADPNGFMVLCVRHRVPYEQNPVLRTSMLRAHLILWGKAPTDVPQLSPEEFFAATVWGNFWANTLEQAQWSRNPARMDPWPEPDERRILLLASVFGCQGLSAGEEEPDAIAHALADWLGSADQTAAFGQSPGPEGQALPLDPAGLGMRPSPGEYFLNSLLVAGFRWPMWSHHSTELLQAGDFPSLPPYSAGARQLRTEAAAAVSWCWVMRDVPVRTPDSPWMVVPRPALLFFLRTFGYAGDPERLSRKAMAIEIRLQSQRWWLIHPALNRLLSVHFPWPTQPMVTWDNSKGLHPVEEGLGSLPSFFVGACVMESISVPNSLEACQLMVASLAPATGGSAVPHPSRIREFAAALAWASNAYVAIGEAQVLQLRLIPQAAFPILQALFPEAASSWEWSNGVGLNQFWAFFGQAWRARDGGMAKQQPTLNIRLHRPGGTGLAPDQAVGEKRPRAILECGNPARVPAAEQFDAREPTDSLASRNVRILLSTNDALVMERNAAVSAAQTLAVRARVLSVHLRRATAAQEDTTRLLDGATARIAALKAESQTREKLLTEHAISFQQARTKLDAQLQLNLTYTSSMRALNGELSDLRAEAETARVIRVRLEEEVAQLRREQQAAAAKAQEFMEAAGAMTQDEHDHRVLTLEAEIHTLQDRVRDLERDIAILERGSTEGSLGSRGGSPRSDHSPLTLTPPEGGWTNSQWPGQLPGP